MFLADATRPNRCLRTCRTRRTSGTCWATSRPPLHPKPQTLNPQPSTLNPQPSTLNPQPSTLNPQQASSSRNFQLFTAKTPIMAKFLKIRILSHHSNEFYCTMSSLKVFFLITLQPRVG